MWLPRRILCLFCSIAVLFQFPAHLTKELLAVLTLVYLTHPLPAFLPLPGCGASGRQKTTEKPAGPCNKERISIGYRSILRGPKGANIWQLSPGASGASTMWSIFFHYALLVDILRLKAFGTVCQPMQPHLHVRWNPGKVDEVALAQFVDGLDHLGVQLW